MTRREGTVVRAKAESPEVRYATDRIVLVDAADVVRLKGEAENNARRRIRLCAHHSVDDRLHEMLIVHTNDTYVRPHKHLDKSESFHVIEGEVDVVVFDEAGSVTEVMPMGTFASGRPFFYRIAAPLFHTLLIRSEVLVFHETTNGPFRRGGHRLRAVGAGGRRRRRRQPVPGRSRSAAHAMTESLLDFYRRHRISPVRQDIRDLDAHFGRRAALYRHLGILPPFVRGRTGLEIGPGSGFNSLYTASLEPSRYVLVEANPRGVEDIRQLFAGFPDLAARIEIVAASADDYQSSDRFEFVFCEGMLALAGVPDPAALLRTVASHTAPGGVLVITCIDAVSDFAETLRRLIAQWLIDPAGELAEHVDRLLPVFSPHLATIHGMSRRHDDWIVDNLLNPASIGPLLSIPDAIAALDGTFDAFGASPRFLTDWRWYKAIASESDRFNELAVADYWSTVHNLIDYRDVWPARDPHENHRLYDACAAVRSAVQKYECDRDRAVLPAVLDGLETIAASTRTFSPATSRAVAAVRTLLESPALDAAAVAASPEFASWFGRGQQYLSFSRRSATTGADLHDRGDH